MQKKLLAVLLIAALITFTSCSNGETKQTTANDGTSAQSSDTSVTEAVTDSNERISYTFTAPDGSEMSTDDFEAIQDGTKYQFITEKFAFARRTTGFMATSWENPEMFEKTQYQSEDTQEAVDILKFKSDEYCPVFEGSFFRVNNGDTFQGAMLTAKRTESSYYYSIDDITKELTTSMGESIISLDGEITIKGILWRVAEYEQGKHDKGTIMLFPYPDSVSDIPMRINYSEKGESLNATGNYWSGYYKGEMVSFFMDTSPICLGFDAESEAAKQGGSDAYVIPSVDWDDIFKNGDNLVEATVTIKGLYYMTNADMNAKEFVSLDEVTDLSGYKK